MGEEISGYFNDDGTPFNPNFPPKADPPLAEIPKPSLCATCKNDTDSKQEILCNLNRNDQTEDMFMCFSYEPNFNRIDGKAVIQEMQDYKAKKYNSK